METIQITVLLKPTRTLRRFQVTFTSSERPPTNAGMKSLQEIIVIRQKRRGQKELKIDILCVILRN